MNPEETVQPKEKQSRRKITIIISTVVGVLLLASGSYLWNNYQNRLTEEEYANLSPEQATLYPDTENFDYYNKILFDIPEYDAISQKYREGIMKVFRDNGFFEPDEGEKRFSMTKIKDRASKVFAFGNFTGQTKNNEPELAFLIQSEDANESKLFIISSDRDVLFRKDYSDAPIINSFKKGDKIFMDSEALQPSPKDGLIIKFKDSKYALVYNESSKNFDEFYQYTNDDIIQNRKERERADDNESQAESEEEIAPNPEETP